MTRTFVQAHPSETDGKSSYLSSFSGADSVSPCMGGHGIWDTGSCSMYPPHSSCVRDHLSVLLFRRRDGFLEVFHQKGKICLPASYSSTSSLWSHRPLALGTKDPTERNASAPICQRVLYVQRQNSGAIWVRLE